jgi:hypothetical protein
MSADLETALAPPQADALLPEQFFTMLRGEGQLAREHLLMLAVLEDAVLCYQRYARARGGAGRRLFVDAEAWLSSRDRSELFSFEAICDALDLDPDYLRQGLFGERRPRAPRRRGPRQTPIAGGCRGPSSRAPLGRGREAAARRPCDGR